jgi:hypothetical protein
LLRNEPSDFAESIVRVLKSEHKYMELSAGARATARKYTVGATTDRVLDVYQEVLQIGYRRRSEPAHA